MVDLNAVEAEARRRIAEKEAFEAAVNAKMAELAKTPRTVTQIRRCEGCRNRVGVSVPTDTQTFEFKCPICFYSVYTNCF
jgi:hypothetical protein